MNFLNESMQAVVLMACEKHAPALLEKLGQCPKGNWFALPSVASCQLGYWPNVSAPHAGQGCAIFGFIERGQLTRQLQKFASVNADGSLCPDCAAYEWSATPSHFAETARDPVCGRHVAPAAALSHQHQGELFFFCDVGCRDSFVSEPNRYVVSPERVPEAVR
jgi:Cu+-exporting ATPase